MKDTKPRYDPDDFVTLRARILHNHVHHDRYPSSLDALEALSRIESRLLRQQKRIQGLRSVEKAAEAFRDANESPEDHMIAKRALFRTLAAQQGKPKP